MDDPRSSIGAAFDPDEALAIVGGDKDLFLELLQTFRQNYAGELSSIRYAIGHRDPDALRHASHHFKGTLSALAAGPARHTVALLEEAGSRADISSAEPIYAELEQQVRLLDEALSNWS